MNKRELDKIKIEKDRKSCIVYNGIYDYMSMKTYNR